MDNLIILLVILSLALCLSIAAFFWGARQQRNTAKLIEIELLEQRQLASSKAQELTAANTQIQNLRTELDQSKLALQSSQELEKKNIAELSAMKAREASEKAAFEEKLAIVQESRQSLAKEFEVLANKLLDQKAEKLKNQQESFYDKTMQPLREQLKEFRQRIDSVHESDSKDRVQLLAEIGQLKQLNLQMSEDAINLTNALKGNQKTQGNWGELILERVLEDSGLRKGYEYEVQSKHYSEDGKLRLPDVVVHLPDNKSLVIDAKVSLVDYQRFCEAEIVEEKEAAVKAHVRSMQQHIKGLSIKDYESLEGVNSLDFVMLFVPIEAAFLLALESDPGLFQFAYDKHIILVSPSTLLATLRTIENLWRYERQNKNAEEIARQAGQLFDQCVLVAESIDDIGKHLDKAVSAHETAVKRLSSGRGNVIKRIDNLKALGAKTKKQLSEKHAQILEGDDLDMLVDNTNEDDQNS